MKISKPILSVIAMLVAVATAFSNSSAFKVSIPKTVQFFTYSSLCIECDVSAGAIPDDNCDTFPFFDLCICYIPYPGLVIEGITVFHGEYHGYLARDRDDPWSPCIFPLYLSN